MSSGYKMPPLIDNIYYPIKNGNYSFASHINNIIDYRFPNSHSFLQGFIAQDIPYCNGAKQYLTISDFPSWLNTDIINSQVNRNLYEIIPTGRPVRPYFDIEYDEGQLGSIETLDTIFSVIYARELAQDRFW